jgi:LuxR family transcriptional regulator, maltose regulon positive regulatory protein
MVAKISAPVLPKLIQRKRLHKVLEVSFRGRVTWIGGPAGSGKTTLVADYVINSSISYLWYHVDEGDHDPASIFRWLAAAVDRASSSRLTSELPVFVPEKIPGLRSFGRAFLRIANERLPPGCVLVFDNVQEVDERAFFYTLVRDGLRELTLDKHVVLISRSDPHRLLANFSASRELTFVNWSALRFTDEEARALVALVAGGEASRYADRLQTVADGWAAGLTLLSIHNRILRNASDAEVTAARMPGVLFDYFAAELLASLDGALQDFLLCTAFLPRLTLAAAEMLSGRADAGHVLEHLHRRNLFIVRRDGEPLTYEYHPLFRQFLRQHIEATRSPAEILSLKRATASALEDTGAIEAAMDLFVDLGDWTAFERLLSRHGFAMVEQARYQTLARWLHNVSECVLEDRPWLRFWAGISQVTTSPSLAISTLTKSYHAFRKSGDTNAACVVWTYAVEVFINLGAYGADVDFWIDEMQKLKSAANRPGSAHLALRVAVLMYAAMEYRRPWHPDAARWRRQALALAQELDREDMQLRVYFYWLQSLTLCGSSKAGTIFAVMDGLIASPAGSSVDRMLCKFSHVGVTTMQGRHEEAIALAREALGFADQESLPVFKPLLLYLLVRAHQNMEEFSEASRVIADLKRLRPIIGPLAEFYFLGVKGIDDYLRGNHAVALAALDTAMDMLGEESLTWAHIVIGFVRGQAHSEIGLHALASRDVALLSAMAHKMGNNALLLHHSFLAEAQLALNRGEDAAALAALREGLARAAQVPICYAYVWKPQTLARLMALALEHEIEPEAAVAIIRQRNLKPPDLTKVSERWPRRFCVTMFGDFSLTRDGVRVDERQRAQLALLQCLICRGGRQISMDSLCDDLWPDAEGDRARQALDVTLLRLRRLLDDKAAIVVANHTITLDPALWKSDLAEFREVVNAVVNEAAAPHVDSSKDRIADLQDRLLNLYRGELLAGMREVLWVLNARKKTERLFVRALSCLGTYWERTADPAAAERCYRRALQIEPNSERLKSRLNALSRRT